MVQVSHTVANKIDAGAALVANGLIVAGSTAGEYIAKGGEAIKSRLRPSPEPVRVSDATKSKLGKAKFVSGAAVTISRALVQGKQQWHALCSRMCSMRKHLCSFVLFWFCAMYIIFCVLCRCHCHE